jgi:hypothetical protein
MKEQLCLWLSVVSAIFAVSAAIFWIKSTKVEQKAAPGSKPGSGWDGVHGRAQRQRRTGALSRNTSRAMAVEFFRGLERRWSSAVSSRAGSGFSTPLTRFCGWASGLSSGRRQITRKKPITELLQGLRRARETATQRRLTGRNKVTGQEHHHVVFDRAAAANLLESHPQHYGRLFRASIRREEAQVPNHEKRSGRCLILACRRRFHSREVTGQIVGEASVNVAVGANSSNRRIALPSPKGCTMSAKPSSSAKYSSSVKGSPHAMLNETMPPL